MESILSRTSTPIQTGIQTLAPRVVESLNQALHRLFQEDHRVFLLGEDLVDPYGGAFKVSRGLSTRFPDRVLGTPISEESIVGLAGGLALCGDKPIVEMMFGDFAALAFDPILNFASKSVTMYGRRLDLNLVVRCPVGGNRSYGATHSQCLQKHFLGIPNLSLFELSPLHDSYELLHRMVNLGHPSMLFEDKILYTQRIFAAGRIDDLFSYELVDGEAGFARVFGEELGEPQVVLVAPGGLFHRCLAAARGLFLEAEIGTEILVPAQLYPFDPGPVLDRLTAAERIFVVEEGNGGGAWGTEVAHQVYQRLWGRLHHRVELIHSADSIIPTAHHLERRVLVQTEDILSAVLERLGHV